MPMYSFTVGAFTPGAGTADGSSLTASTYMALQGGVAAQVSFIDEIEMAGQAGAATSPLIMLLGRDSTVVATPTALATPNSNGLLDPSGGVLTNLPVGAITGATQAIRSNSVTLAKKNLTFNAYGGVLVRNWANTQDRMGIIGVTASLGEVSLSSFTGSTAAIAIGAHMLYETK